MKNAGLVLVGVGIFAVWYLTRASAADAPKWPAGTNLGYDIIVQSVTKVGGVWMYVLAFEGTTAGPWTQAQVEAYLALYE